MQTLAYQMTCHADFTPIIWLVLNHGYLQIVLSHATCWLCAVWNLCVDIIVELVKMMKNNTL